MQNRFTTPRIHTVSYLVLLRWLLLLFRSIFVVVDFFFLLPWLFWQERDEKKQRGSSVVYNDPDQWFRYPYRSQHLGTTETVLPSPCSPQIDRGSAVLWIYSISITWEHTGNANAPGPGETQQWGPSICVLTSIPGDSDAHLGLRTNA